MRNIDLKIYFGLLWVMMPCSFVGWKLILCEKLLHRKWWIGFTQNVNKHLPSKTVSTCNNTSVFLSLPLIFNVGLNEKVISELTHFYTGCHRRNGPNFGRVFLMLNYTDITQNTYVQSWTVSEIMASAVWNFDSCYTLTDYQIHIETGRNMWFL